MYMRSRLDQIESTIKALFEGNSTIFPWTDERSSLIQKLLESIQEYLEEMEGELINLPKQFLIYMNPQDQQFIEKQDGWNAAVSNFINDLAVELGYHIEKNAELRLIARNSLSTGEVQVKAVIEPQNNSQTSAVPVLPSTTVKTDDQIACKAFLILGDNDLFPLEKPVINIGRKSDNHLVINDLRVSRTHAQIRAISDGFIIFDISSSGGTYINGERISQRKLQSGDVISLAGIKMIFTQDQPGTIGQPNEITSELKSLPSSGGELC